jgi:hypothetical protein
MKRSMMDNALAWVVVAVCVVGGLRMVTRAWNQSGDGVITSGTGRTNPWYGDDGGSVVHWVTESEHKRYNYGAGAFLILLGGGLAYAFARRPRATASVA